MTVSRLNKNQSLNDQLLQNSNLLVLSTIVFFVSTISTPDRVLLGLSELITNIKLQLYISGIEIINARLGTTLNFDKVLPCLPQDERRDGSICLEWMDRARLYLHFYSLQDHIKCYNLKWIALNDQISPTDCIEMATGVHW